MRTSPRQAPRAARAVLSAVVVLAVGAASTAQAGQLPAGQAEVLTQRAQAQAQLWPKVESARAQAQKREQLEAALTKRGRALNQILSETEVSAASAPGGFSWSDAGVGAGTAFGVTLVAAGVALSIRRVRRPASA